MGRIPEHLARKLGIPTTAQLIPLDPIRPEASDAAQGQAPLSGQLATLALATLLSGPIKDSPASFEELSLHTETIAAGISHLRLWDHGPIFQLVGPAVAKARIIGKTELGAQEVLYLDAREEAAVWIPGDEESPGVVLRFNPTRDVDTELVDVAGDDLGIADWIPPASVDFAVPDLGGLTADFGCPDWLDREFHSMVATGSSYRKAVAVGLVGRLWSLPTEAAKRKLALESLGAAGPAARARQWYERLPAEAKTSLEASARDRAYALLDQLSELRTMLASNEELARSLALAWLHGRDDLETFSFLSKSSDLQSLLASVDTAAACENTLWGVLGPFDEDDRLREVSWQEPESWWGGLVFA